MDCPFKVLIGGFLYFKKYVIKGVKKSQRTVSFGFQNIQVLYNTMYMLTDVENVLLAMLRISECHCWRVTTAYYSTELEASLSRRLYCIWSEEVPLPIMERETLCSDLRIGFFHPTAGYGNDSWDRNKIYFFLLYLNVIFTIIYLQSRVGNSLFGFSCESLVFWEWKSDSLF